MYKITFLFFFCGEVTFIWPYVICTFFFCQLLGKVLPLISMCQKDDISQKVEPLTPLTPFVVMQGITYFLFSSVCLVRITHQQKDPLFPHPSNPRWLFHYSIRGAISWRLSEAEDAAPFSSTSNHSLSCITSWQCRFDFFLPVHSVIFCCDIMK